ncbi:MAG: M1 family metallopeptidase [Myxococcales bacterium]|nr:M1 family metallopeptidase [Myxococcales bacterium]
MRAAVSLALALALAAAPAQARPGSGALKFAQLGPDLPTPGETRLASGAPGPAYWQQRADYRIDVEVVDAERPRIVGRERITYANQSPHELTYLWLQLDQNRLRRDALGWLAETAPGFERFGYRELQRLLAMETFEGGVRLGPVLVDGKPAAHTVVHTMMRVDLPRPLAAGRSVQLDLSWEHDIVNAKVIWARGGYEQLDEQNRIYTIAQWYPRMAAYTDYQGWQHKQFLGRGEFTLELGDFDVRITVPADHVVAATGVLKNPEEVLDRAWRDRLAQAAKAKSPVLIITRPEAEARAAAAPATGKKTWRFQATNVRDFAFASSRAFLWDAMAAGRALAMSYYPPQAEPLWRRFSTQAVAHTLEVYGRMTFEYPYPVAISVNGPIGGMEYPMISFNGPRAEDDGTYYDRAGEGKRWKYSKYGLISVVIHEVGHNWFPMIINSDERQWSWMDEGLNTFVQFVAEQEWEAEYPSWRGHPRNIVDYMKSTEQVPIMTNSESILQFGNNAYAKPATALNILRETILGREAFDFAFRTYAQRWRFRHPEPADLFRTLEDASGVDLDWFWRGWFYTTLHADIALAGVHEFTVDSRDPQLERSFQRQQDQAREPESLTRLRNKSARTLVDELPELKDFYNDFDEYTVTDADRDEYRALLDAISDEERALLRTGKRFYVVELENRGGLVMPVILELRFADGAREELRIPAELWRRDARRARTLIIRDKPLQGVTLDPHLETADADQDNNHWPPQLRRSRFQLFKDKQNRHRKTDPSYDRYREYERRQRERAQRNPMQEARGAEEAR